MEQHEYADILKAIADGKEVEYQDFFGFWWIVSTNTALTDIIRYTGDKSGNAPIYRVKPEKVYPTTTFTGEELRKSFLYGKSSEGADKALVRIANEVLKRYIDEQENV